MLPQTTNMVRHGQLSATASQMSPRKGCSSLVCYTWDLSAMWLKPYLLQAVQHRPSLRCPSLTAASKVASPSTTFGAPQRLETSAPRLKPLESMTNSQTCTEAIIAEQLT